MSDMEHFAGRPNGYRGTLRGGLVWLKRAGVAVAVELGTGTGTETEIGIEPGALRSEIRLKSGQKCWYELWWYSSSCW